MSPCLVLQLLYLLLAVSYVVSQYTNRPGSTECSTARGDPGSCIALRNCPDLDRRFRSAANQHELQFLIREYGCGFRQSVPFVCCPGDYGNNWDRPPTEGGGWTWPRQTTRTTTPTPSRRPPTSASPPPKRITTSTEKANLKMGHRNRRLLPENSCGKTLGVKILGGTTAGIDEFPWMAMIQYQFSTGRTTFGCGGSLISSRYVLTAAHCIRGPDIPSNLKVARVRLGEFDTSKARDCQGETCAPPPQDIEVENIIVHKEYQPRNPAQYNDIALIRLKREPTLSKFVSPICIPLDERAKKSYAGEKLVAAGWGRTQNVRGSSSDTMQKIALPFVSLADCSPFYSRNSIQLKSTQICAGGEAKKDSCSGDSGGPLMTTDIINSQPRWLVTGIVSFGPSTCGTENAAGVYTKVSDYTNWILDNMTD